MDTIISEGAVGGGHIINATKEGVVALSPNRIAARATPPGVVAAYVAIATVLIARSIWQPS